MEYEVYILRCENGSLYTGIAKDSFERFEKHKTGKGAKYTRMFKPIKIELILRCTNRIEASKIEKYIKSKTKLEKENYIKETNSLEKIILNSIKIKVSQKKF
ncbi:GIY-YIG nuclease family protein [Fusobacterium russii]|uniref:GIY-YIG nuclease family protein n=1 Tax=Fusobacterium russii TaxID=854 RepID=UPI00039EE494|nr:GIY-YIG nuclease family protein [Fusobacterium russii]